MNIEELNYLQRCEKVIEDDFFNAYLDKKSKAALCVCKQSYIPAEDFINSFNQIADILEKTSLESFVFDKRALRAFHQPTMEWYFVEWKNRIYNYGVNKHYKILPPQDWFADCVEAGKASILKNNPSFEFEKFDIKYCDSIIDAIE